MADIAAIVDTAEALGLQGGKRNARSAGHGAKLADFLATFTARLSVEEGKAVGVTQGGAAAIPDGEAEAQPQAAPDKTGPEDNPVAALIQTGPEEGRSTVPVLAVPGQVAEDAALIGAEEEGEATTLGARRLAHILARNGEAGGMVGKGGTQETPAKAADDGAAEGQILPLNAQAGLETQVSSDESAIAFSGRQNEALLTAATQQPAQPTLAETQSARSLLESMPKAVEQRLNVAVEAPVKSPAFPGEFAEKIVWLSSRQGQVAELSLNPPQLGTVEVRLTVSAGGEAGAQFFSPSPVVRDAIEAALPRLRELMAQAGLQLGDSQVRDQALGQGGEGTPRGWNGGEGQADLQSETAGILAGTRRSGLGLVDLYA